LNWEAVIAIITVADLFFTVISLLWIRSVDAKANTINAQNARIDSLEKALQQKTEQVVDSRFGVLAAEFNIAVTRLDTLVGLVQKRLETGEAEFKEDDNERHRLEIKFITKIAETCATREDMHQIEKRMTILENTVARFMGSMQHRVPHV
jgi:hypothetical protein